MAPPATTAAVAAAAVKNTSVPVLAISPDVSSDATGVESSPAGKVDTEGTSDVRWDPLNPGAVCDTLRGFVGPEGATGVDGVSGTTGGIDGPNDGTPGDNGGSDGVPGVDGISCPVDGTPGDAGTPGDCDGVVGS